MPSTLLTIASWGCLTMGLVGLWRGGTLLSRGRQARDSEGTPAWAVMVESGGLALIGVAVLLGGRWMHLIWLALALMTIGAVAQARRSLRRRRLQRSGA